MRECSCKCLLCQSARVAYLTSNPFSHRLVSARHYSLLHMHSPQFRQGLESKPGKGKGPYHATKGLCVIVRRYFTAALLLSRRLYPKQLTYTLTPYGYMHTGAIAGLSILPEDTSACWLSEPGIKHPTLGLVDDSTPINMLKHTTPYFSVVFCHHIFCQ